MSVRIARRSVVAGLALALLTAPGCGEVKEDEPSRNPPNPVSRADLPQPVKPSSEKKETSKVESDLHKDLGGGPIIKPDATTKTAPANRPGTP